MGMCNFNTKTSMWFASTFKLKNPPTLLNTQEVTVKGSVLLQCTVDAFFHFPNITFKNTRESELCLYLIQQLLSLKHTRMQCNKFLWVCLEPPLKPTMGQLRTVTSLLDRCQTSFKTKKISLKIAICQKT